MAHSADVKHGSMDIALKEFGPDLETAPCDISNQTALEPQTDCSVHLNINNILQLNDDCLDEIFRNLSLSDLLAISDTCTRFKAIAPKVFTFVHKVIDLSTLVVRDEARNHTDITKCEQLLRNFGHFITTLVMENVNRVYQYPALKISAIETRILEEKNLSLMNQLVACRPVSLKSLHLHDFVIDDEIPTVLRSICGNLDSLTMDNCQLTQDISNPFLFFERCKQLKNLKVRAPSSVNFHTLFDNSFPQLEELSLERFKFNQIDDKIVKSFFENHTTLKCLKIDTSKGDMEGSRLFNHIQSYFNGALELTWSFSLVDDTLKPVLQPFLKSLNLFYCCRPDHSSIDATQLFSECTELLTLAIPAGLITNAMKLCFPQLEYLELHSDINDIDTIEPFELEEFLKHQRKLKELIFNCCLRPFLVPFLPEIIENDLTQLRRFFARGLTNFVCLKQLKNIRKIFFYTYQKEGLIDFIRDTASVESVEHLELCLKSASAELIAAIGKFTVLRQLTLNMLWYDPQLAPTTGNHFVNLVMELRNLRILTLNLRNFELDAETHNRINEIVGERNQSLAIFTNVFKEDFPPYDIQFEFGKRVADTN